MIATLERSRRTAPTQTVRCAIYTRKSSEEGLSQDFNSLDAQREACAAFVQSQKHEGWVMLPTLYDDGGYSGGSTRKPLVSRDNPRFSGFLPDAVDELEKQRLRI